MARRGVVQRIVVDLHDAAATGSYALAYDEGYAANSTTARVSLFTDAATLDCGLRSSTTPTASL